jgi:DNA end-binding protein Ku
VNQMTQPWEPKRYTDDYSSSLMKMIKDKIANGDKAAGPAPKAKRQTNVIDLAAVLEESLKQSASPRARDKSPKSTKKKKTKHRKAA